jgi:hypothetical protein
MNARDRVQLLFGPYKAPALRRGGRAFCLLRDCTVVVTSWTDARVPWPRCRALDGPGRGSGLLLDEELARAVRHESAAAVMYWWGASHGAVERWRRALGVGRTDNEGSHRLICAAAEQGAAELRGKELPPEQVERRRQTALDLDLARHLQTGYHGDWWSDEEVALLGTVPDEEVARRTGRTPDACRSKRQLLGIPNPSPRAGGWTQDEDDLVRRLPPRLAARRTGRSMNAVYRRRHDLGLPDARVGSTDRQGRRRPPHVVEAVRRANLVRHPSEETRRRMSEAHRRRGTRPPKAGRPWTAAEDRLLRRLPPPQVTERTGRSLSAVYTRRHELGLPDARAGRKIPGRPKA